MNIDLNCDLGEGEPAQRTCSLMRWITSANVACGGHAGDVRSMAACVRRCKKFGIRLGAHPGIADRQDFGRAPVALSRREIELLLLHQVSALERLAEEHAMKLHHIKLHGALYHATEAEADLAAGYVETVRRFWPKAIIVAQAGRRVARLAARSGLTVWGEAFLDRAYNDDGLLVPRTSPGALLTDLNSIFRRVTDLRERRGWTSISGRRLTLCPQTLCIHSDTPSALLIARTVHNLLRLDLGQRSAGN